MSHEFTVEFALVVLAVWETGHISGPTKAKHEYTAPAWGTLPDLTKFRIKRKSRVVSSWQGGKVRLNIQLC